MDAQVVYERQPGGDVQRGPCEFQRIGVRFGDRVVWLGAAFFPGRDNTFEKDVSLAEEIVRLCTIDPDAKVSKLRASIASMMKDLAVDRERQRDGSPLFTPYVEQCNAMLANT